MTEAIRLSGLATRVLRDHAARPEQLFYDINPLGNMFGRSALATLDAAYVELVDAGFMESAGDIVMFFGDVKELYRVTPRGSERATELTSATR
jgi:hypothetical protein